MLLLFGHLPPEKLLWSTTIQSETICPSSLHNWASKIHDNFATEYINKLFKLFDTVS